MKKRIILYLTLPVLFLAFLSGFLFLKEGSLSKVNTVQINLLVKQAEKDWGHINNQTFQAAEANDDQFSGKKAETAENQKAGNTESTISIDNTESITSIETTVGSGNANNIKITKNIERTQNYDFAVIDITGNILYSTYEIEQDSYSEIINKAMQEHDTIADITLTGKSSGVTAGNKEVEDSEIVGKLIVKNNLDEILEQKEQRLLLVFIMLLLCLTFLLIGYVFYLEKKLFRPFGKLEKFAAHVAVGNLDMQLTMDKDNLFGAFTESFDLMRENLKTARAKEHEANKEKQELIASLSHDIKTPIASIKAVAEIMALTSKDKHIAVIQEKAEQINHLINDLFQSTLEELGELKVTLGEYDSRELLTILEGVDYGNKVKIVTEIPACLLVFDKLRLTQVFDNIIGNSYKYADTEIDVRFVLKDSCFSVIIKDFGPGVKEEEIPLIGGKFYRGENAVNKDGSGLGLYVSSVLVSKMKGELEFYKEPDGFVVKVELALAGK